jgi:hypothetical protein
VIIVISIIIGADQLRMTGVSCAHPNMHSNNRVQINDKLLKEIKTNKYIICTYFEMFIFFFFRTNKKRKRYPQSTGKTRPVFEQLNHSPCTQNIQFTIDK